jgi:hypothetical protein
MLIAPFSVPPSTGSRIVSRPPARSIRPPTKTLILWLVAGIAVLLCVPVARGGGTLGGTLPFWLVAAPLIDLAWIDRRRIARRAVEFLRRSGRRRAMAQSLRRQRNARPAACNAARS